MNTNNYNPNEKQSELKEEIRELISDILGELGAYLLLSVGLILIFTFLFAFAYFFMQFFLPLQQAVIASLGVMAVTGIGCLFYQRKPSIKSNHYWLFFAVLLGIELIYRFYNILVVPESLIWLQVQENAIYGTIALIFILTSFIFILYSKLSKLQNTKT